MSDEGTRAMPTHVMVGMMVDGKFASYAATLDDLGKILGVPRLSAQKNRWRRRAQRVLTALAESNPDRAAEIEDGWEHEPDGDACSYTKETDDDGERPTHQVSGGRSE